MTRQTKTGILTLLLLALLVAPIGATVYYVDGTKSGDGSSWSTAENSVQAAIDAASSGDEVWVKAIAGCYNEHITMKAGVSIYGGFAGTETERSQRDWDTNVTRLDGTGLSNSVITAGAGITTATFIDGFTIQNGVGIQYTPYAYGGGLYCTSGGSPTISHNRIINNTATHGGGILASSSSSPVIEYNTIQGNEVTTCGGGISMYNGIVRHNTITLNVNSLYGGGAYISSYADQITISDNTITENQAASGAGISCGDTAAQISDNTISDNTATGTGGGVYCGGGTVTIDGNEISGNDANYSGGISCNGGSATISGNTVDGNGSVTYGGICTYQTTAVITGNTVSNNTATANVGGIACAYGGSPVVTGNSVTGNEAGTDSGGMKCWGNSATISNNLFQGNEATTSSGGLSCSNFGGEVSNNVIEGNTAGTYAGGVFLWGCSPTIANNLIAGNVASTNGAGLWWETELAGVQGSVTNNTIVGNTTVNAVHINGVTASVANNIIAFNSSGFHKGSTGTLTITYNDVYNPSGYDYSWTPAPSGNISTDPLFVGSGDYHLTGSSPCIDTGWNSAPSLPSTDMDGQPRIMPSAGTVDIGADEYDATPPSTPVVTDDGAYAASTTQLRAMWTADDDESGVAEYQYAIGTAQYPATGYDFVATWTSRGTITSVIRTDLTLTDGQTYYFSVRAKNGQGNWSDVGVSDGIVVDTTPPTVTVEQAVGQQDPAHVCPILFTVVFSEPVIGFRGSGVILGGTATATDCSVTDSGDHKTYLVAVNGVVGEGMVTASVPTGVAFDAAFSGNAASTSVDNSVTYTFTHETVSSVAASADGRRVRLLGRRVTAVFDDRFYVQDSSDVGGYGTRGLCVDYYASSQVTGVGETVNIEGVVGTRDGEKCIPYATVTSASRERVPLCVYAMPNKLLGGGDWQYDSQTGGGQRGITDTCGWNNVGLLVESWGRVSLIDGTSFSIDDGSAVNVKVLVPSDVTLPEEDDYVFVTGISSCKESGSDLVLLLRVRGQSDIRVAQASDTEAVSMPTYAEWNQIALPIVPADPSVETVLATAPGGLENLNLQKFSAVYQGYDVWDGFETPPGASFGKMLLGQGYLFSPGESYTIGYSGFRESLLAVPGYRVAIAVSLPGAQNDGLNTGGWHLIGHPLDHYVAVDSGSFVGDGIFLTDGQSVRTWGEASANSEWCDSTMTWLDASMQNQMTLGFEELNDDYYLRAGLGYSFHTYKDNLALIIPNADTTSPSVTVEQAAGQPDPSGAPILFTVAFSEPVFGFDNSDVTIGGTAGATVAVVTDPGDHQTYSVAVSGMTAFGTVTASVSACAATDADGNENLASTSVDNTVIYGSAPAVEEVTSPSADRDYIAGEQLVVQVKFSTEVVVDTTSGTPRIELDTGLTKRSATYAGVSDARTLDFVYSVQPGDFSGDLDFTSVNALSLDGGVVKDTSGRAASTVLPEPGQLGSLSVNKNISIVPLATGNGDVIYVRPDGDNSKSGDTWDNAWMSPAAATLAASHATPKKQVWVCQGVYYCCTTLPAGVALLGGFSGSGSERDPMIYTTILDGQKFGCVVKGAEGGLPSDTVIDGFTIRNGSGFRPDGLLIQIVGASGSWGGGIYCSGSSPTISNNRIQYCGACTGGGIFCYDSSAEIVGNEVSSCSGGGIFLSGAGLIANNNVHENTGGVSVLPLTGSAAGITCSGGCIVSQNTVANNGDYTTSPPYGTSVGGISCSTSCTVCNNTVDGNSGLFAGGIMCSGSPAVVNNTIVGNGSLVAGGVLCLSNSSPTIANNVINNNSSGIMKLSTSTPVLSHNDVYGNDGTNDNNYVGFAEDPKLLYGNIYQDPLLIGGGDYHLQPGSPCIDHAADNVSGLPAVDRDGDPRPVDGDGVDGTAYDIGAYEFQRGNPPVVVISPPSPFVTSTGSITYTVTYVNADVVTLSQSDVTVISQIGSIAATVDPIGGSGTVTRTVTLSGVSGDGKFTIRIAAGTASNGAGSAGLCQAVTPVIVDNTAPLVSIVNPPEGEIHVAEYKGVEVAVAVTELNLVPASPVDVGFTDVSSSAPPAEGDWHHATYNVDRRIWTYTWQDPQPSKIWVRAKDLASNTTTATRVVSSVLEAWCTLFVNGASPNAADDDSHGSSWDLPYKSVQAAMDYASDRWPGTDIWVAAGTYAESSTITLAPRVGLYGGFAGFETVREQRDWREHETILVGSCGCIESSADEMGWPTLDGFTIKGGAGVAVDCDNSSIRISNNRITESAYGILCSRSSSPVIVGNVLVGNGYGIASSFSNAQISNNAITTCSEWAIADIDYSNSAICNNTVVGNARGIVSETSTTTAISNNIVAFCTYQGICAGNSATPSLSHNCVYGNGTDYVGLTPDVGSISPIVSSPMFVDRGGQDYHLVTGSPCIDAGSDAVAGLPTRDIDGTSRPMDGNNSQSAEYDVGAYEYVPDVSPPICSVAGPSEPVCGELPASVDFTITFNEPVTGLTAAAISVTGAQKGALDGANGQTTYVLHTLANALGAVTCQVPANVAYDGSANGNVASAGACEVGAAPPECSAITATNDLTPVIRWVASGPDSRYHIIVTNVNDSQDVWDSGEVVDSPNGVRVDRLLQDGATYSVVVKLGTICGWGDWSPEITFTVHFTEPPLPSAVPYCGG